MNRVILQRVILFFISLLLFSSCMGEGRHVETGQTFGVVRFDYKSGLNLLDVSEVDVFYSIRFKEAYEGNCFLIAYEIDFERPENSFEMVNATGYLTVDILDKMDVDRWPVTSVTDTSQAMTNEVAIISPTYSGEFYYIKGMFFIISSLEIPTNQTMTWHLSYDMDNMMTEEYGQKYFNIYLRTTYVNPGTYSKETIGVANAFEMKYLMENIVKQVKEAGGELFKFRIHYPSSISEDGQIKWDKQDTGEIRVEYIIPS